MGGPGSGQKPKVYPPEMVATVERMYAEGHTQVEVARALGVTQRVIQRLMVRHAIPARLAAKRDQTGEKNHAWRGSGAGYKALHLRVAAARGKPQRCDRCGTTDGRHAYDWANLTGRYDDINDYERMCRSCHRRYDAERRG